MTLNSKIYIFIALQLSFLFSPSRALPYPFSGQKVRKLGKAKMVPFSHNNCLASDPFFKSPHTKRGTKRNPKLYKIEFRSQSCIFFFKHFLQLIDAFFAHCISTRKKSFKIALEKFEQPTTLQLSCASKATFFNHKANNSPSKLDGGLRYTFRQKVDETKFVTISFLYVPLRVQFTQLFL